jgi:chemotaxis signal transduction protein
MNNDSMGLLVERARKVIAKQWELIESDKRVIELQRGVIIEQDALIDDLRTKIVKLIGERMEK